MSYTGSNGAVLTAVNPMLPNEPPYIPSSESTVSGRSSSPEHPAERVSDSSSMPAHTSLAMQYVNHSNMATGYAYADHGRAHGVTDVDVDEKPHYVYETMTDLQDARHRMMMNMNGGPPSRSPNLKDHVDGVKYAGIPNKPRKQYGGASCVLCSIHVLWNCFLFILVVGAFGLSVYNFLNGNGLGVPVDAPTQSPGSTLPSTGVAQELHSYMESVNKTFTDLRNQLEMVTAEHNNRYQQLNTTIHTAVQSLRTVSAANELDLTAGCPPPRQSTCVINHLNANTPPTSVACETQEVPLTEAGFRNVNIFCAVDNSGLESNPITSTLNIYNAQVSCLCSIVALTAPTASVACTLVIERCPETISLNTTNGQ